MSNTYNNQNLLQDSVVFGTFTNCDVVAGGTPANAKFKRNVLIGGDLTLGLESSTTTNGVIEYTDTSGNIIVRINGIFYTITPTILKYLSTITSDYATTINNFIDKNSNQTITGIKTFSIIPTYSGTALVSTLNDGTLSTTKFVKDQGYLTSNSLNGNYTIGTTANLLTINSQLLATNGFFSTTLVYNAYTNDYNRFFGNFIMFYNFTSAPTGVQYLPTILTGKSTTITILNNTPYTLQLSANTGSGIYGLVAPLGATVVSLLSTYTYTFVIIYGASAYDNWYCTVINTNNKLVDEGTDCTIGGTKTFSTAPLYSGAYPANDNSTKLASTSWVKGVGYLTSSSLTGLANLNSPNFTNGMTLSSGDFLISNGGVVNSGNYNLRNTYGNTGIISVGTFTSPSFLGQGIHLKIYSHSGFNGLNSQDYVCEIFLKVSNTSSAGGDVSDFPANSWCYRYGANATSSYPTWLIANSNKLSFTLYITAPYYNNSSFYEVSYSKGCSWTNDDSYFSGSLPSSIYSVLPSIDGYILQSPFIIKGTTEALTPLPADNSTRIATTEYVKSQNYLTSVSLSSYVTNTSLSSTLSSYVTNTSLSSTLSSYVTNTSLSNYASKDNPTFTTKITTPFILLSAPIYCELGARVATANPKVVIASANATYSSAGDTFGFSSSIYNSGSFTTTYARGSLETYVSSGYNTSLFGWNGSSWIAPQTGKYQISVHFYINSNNVFNRFTLNRYNSSNVLLYNQFCLVGFSLTSDTLRHFTTILPMNTGDYFNIQLSSSGGNTVMYFAGTLHSTMKIMLLG